MTHRDYGRLFETLSEEYKKKSPRSHRLHEKAKKVMIDGGNHAIRLIEPFPPRIVKAQGAYVTDEDDHSLLDFWQGHHANILGHNPPRIWEPVREALASGCGLQSGFTDKNQVEAASLLCETTGAEAVRFTTSGTLATMYSILLAKAHTGRDLVMKVGGGWHGSQPWGLKGVDYDFPIERFQHVDSEGLPASLTSNIIITSFNDCEMLERQMKEYGDKLACFIVEPFIGAGGFFPADREYIETAGRLTRKYGVVLIFDEVISGFRFHPGSIGKLYGVVPDLATYGKIIGGGMPVSAVGGRRDILRLCGRETGIKVRFFGGTYSGHPASMLASKLMLTYLIEQRESVYPYINQIGKKMRDTVVGAFEQAGLPITCTGGPNEVLPGSSLGMIFFPAREGAVIRTPEDTKNPDVCDLVLSNKMIQLALLVEDVHVVHGLGSVTPTHTDADIERLGKACTAAAARIVRYVT